jgi:hypothetical protein
MFRGFRFTLTSLACLAGVRSGVLMTDGTFINFRGEQLGRAIIELAEADPAV